jgi:guanylate kinase
MSVGFRAVIRRLGQQEYHYASTKRFARKARSGEAITLRDVDGDLVKAVITHVRRGPSIGKQTILIVHADEIED